MMICLSSKNGSAGKIDEKPEFFCLLTGHSQNSDCLLLTLIRYSSSLPSFSISMLLFSWNLLRESIGSVFSCFRWSANPQLPMSAPSFIIYRYTTSVVSGKECFPKDFHSRKSFPEMIAKNIHPVRQVQTLVFCGLKGMK